MMIVVIQTFVYVPVGMFMNVQVDMSLPLSIVFVNSSTASLILKGNFLQSYPKHVSTWKSLNTSGASRLLSLSNCQSENISRGVPSAIISRFVTIQPSSFPPR